MMTKVARVTLLAVAFLALVPAAAIAQSSFAGVVKDISGAVLPGVTVEASSPVLIEKARTAVTDGEGLYKIVDLRPGVYTITFTIPGFSTIKREGVELPATFTATVNAEMRVGAVEETITVTGQQPVIDVQNVTQQKVLAQDVIDALPAGRAPTSLTALIPGVVTLSLGADVLGKFNKSLSIHDSRTGEEVTAVDGFPTRQTRGPGGGNETYFVNPGTVQEISVQSAALSAESPMSGISSNLIPKEGSNTYTGYLFAAYADHNLASSNLTNALRARGLTAVDGIKQLWEFNPAVGGRVFRDKLWFFSSYRYSGAITYIANNFYNLTPTAWVYTPDKSRPAVAEVKDPSYANRLTWQVDQKNKINMSYDYQPHLVYGRNYGTSVSPEATNYTPYAPDYFAQVAWKSPVSNRLLLEAGVVQQTTNKDQRLQNGVDPTTVSATEQSTSKIFRAPTITNTAGYQDSAPGLHQNALTTIRAVGTYVTGSHAVKTGFTLMRGINNDRLVPNGDMAVTLFNGAPRSLTLSATPYEVDMKLNADLGVFAQDQWTVKRLTLNGAVRFDYLHASALPVHLPAVRFAPARNFPGVDNVPNWKDISPRVGVSYDLFGDGRTALKVTLSKYLQGIGTDYAQGTNGVATSTPVVTRTWTDRNGDFVPDCDLLDPVTNGECGPMSDANFGKNNPNATQYDPALLHGFGKRGYNWETSAAVQRLLADGVSVNIGYFRRWYGNFTVTDNRAVTSADYNPYCLTVPIDSRLPNGGGNQECGFYDVDPSKFNQVRNFVTFAKNYGKQTEVFNGVDLTINARFAKGVQVSGGASTGRTETNNCFVVNSPQQLHYCDVKPPFQPNIKFFAIYPLPWWGVQASAVFQSVPGAQDTATYPATSKEISTSLGRDLAAGANGTALLEIIQPGTIWEARMNQVDLRVTRAFKFGHARILGSMDVVNLLNGSGISAITTRYGPAWLQPATVQGPRFFQFSTQLNF